MKINSTGFDGLLLIETPLFNDIRGGFHKVFSKELFKNSGLSPEFAEFYYSISHKDVIRGMHFQVPPFDHEKLVWVSNGAIIDVVIDLRQNSKTFNKFYSVRLSSLDTSFLYIPKGFAHGFLSLEDNTIVNYAQTSVYNSSFDCGISYDSIGYKWPVEKAIVSNRDRSFKSIDLFESPFL